MTSPSIPLLTRRTFIGLLGTAALARSCGLADDVNAASAESARPSVGSNIYGWSQYYQRQGKNVNEHLDEVFSSLRAAGYDYLESFLDVQEPENNGRIAQRMQAQKLQPVCLYTGARLHEAGKAHQNIARLVEAVAVARKAGFTLIDCNPDPIGRDKTNEELAIQAKALNDLGAELKRLGVRLGIHNHMPEMANGAREFHHILEHTDPELVGLCYDVHWVFRGGLAPQECLKRYGKRVVSWHLRQSRNGTWWEDLDTGDIDYSFVANYARQHALAAPLTVELALEKDTEVTRSVQENHQRSREFVRRVFGA